MHKIDMFSVQEAAYLLMVSDKTVDKWTREGLLSPHWTPSRHRYYTRDELLEFSKTKLPNLRRVDVNLLKAYDRLWTPAAAAKLLRVTYTTLRTWEQEKRLIPVRKNGRRKYRYKDLVDFLSRYTGKWYYTGTKYFPREDS